MAKNIPMSQFNSTAFTAATAATTANISPTRPTAGFGSAVSTGAFSSTFQQVQNDVAGYISRGDGGFSNNLAPSSAQAMQLAALNARQVGGAIDDGAVDSESRQQFLASVKPWASEAADKLGVAPELVVAHAALESGWGRQPLRKGGIDTNNLFGIKAGGNWQGEVASATTTEFEHGAMLKKTERFRSYPDTASAFRDYADMLAGNPRYQAALNTGGDARAFANGLARGGYATDPGYADKLARLATQLQRAAASAAD
ncbi:peptidoglycan hydrolase FlgJ [Duganella phyllosphaerae]|uniref:Peptidoglycan hydrolase FlgJ n=2 Tax=Telluria group TaxID=2895353 RepID=A0A1E7X5I3_9BURK|nr:peptidoglycan hydrolase FlgJ [Duganella phyllosphaerae]